jgi:sulfocyanin
MKRFSILSALAVFAACGGGEPAESGAASSASAEPAEVAAPTAKLPGGEMTTPEWFAVDADAQVAHIVLTAGATNDNNYWNYNGGTKGSMAITVPVGYTVTIDLVNNDPAMAHSVGVSAETSSFGAMLDPTPVFTGAVTENPTSMVDGTMPGETDTVTFTADAAGTYTLVCYIPGHGTTGMWVYFVVSADGSAGVQGAM